MSIATLNGNAGAERKSLAGQIDRLDGILDGLAENLDAAVADAVRGAVAVAVTEVVSDAVRVAVKEVLGNPDLLRLALARHESKRRPLRERLAGACRWMWDRTSSAVGSVARVVAWCVEKARARFRGVRDGARGAADWLAAANEKVRLAFYRLWLLRRSCAIALAVGVVCGLFCQVSGPTTASLVGGLSSALLTLGGLVLAPFWGALRRSGWLG